MAKRLKTCLKATESVSCGREKDAMDAPLVYSQSSDQSRSGSTQGLVPVVDGNNHPLFPCKSGVARCLVRDGKAIPFYRKGFFCIKLKKVVEKPAKKKIAMAIDHGSKRTGITIASCGHIILNIQCDTPCWIKAKMESRLQLRRSRRQRKTPYRKCRSNRAIGRVPPSTKARWDLNLRLLDQLCKIIPITRVVLEDIKAKPRPGKRRWNVNFSPLEVGKKYFEEEIRSRGLKFSTFRGTETSDRRDQRGFKKTKDKLAEKWEAHCVDSHCLAEMELGKNIVPVKDMYVLSLIKFHRRNLHLQNFAKGGVRRSQGGTRSLGLNRGTLVKHPKWGLTYVGGVGKTGMSLHSLASSDRVCRNAKKEDLKILTNMKWRAAFLPGLKAGVPCRRT